ncbi:MAG: hypothetical protein M3083_16110 [Actinomycetota bacterium]|nr:hypothetical protein [Actinomycetota bacterium]
MTSNAGSAASMEDVMDALDEPTPAVASARIADSELALVFASGQFECRYVPLGVMASSPVRQATTDGAGTGLLSIE